MPLFQSSVIKNHDRTLDSIAIKAAWQRFQLHFADPVKQDNIRKAKEEQYQEGFLRELFVDVLGYTLNPQPGYDLITEQKNEKDGKKADGALLKAGAVRGVIELKGTDTTDLGKIEKQAFGYLTSHKDCVYVVISNFEKLRFYVQNSTEHEEFNLFTLTEERFRLLWLLLQKNQIAQDIPLKLKEQSVAQEDQVTRKLYADYSAFKKALFADIVARNAGHDKVELYRKTQKLLDRFLFVLFAEDRGLLPPNSVRKTLADWQDFKEKALVIPLYDRFKTYFGWVNNGFRNKDFDIFAYNGGLFAPDEVLDNIAINDDLLYDHTYRLSQYDFESEVDVNILGHIFEHSLNDIEQVQAEAEGTDADRTKGRRKKEGVFYTPRYITRYIVENTVGTLCTEKKTALGIVEEEYAPQQKKKDRKALLQKLEDYRRWLESLTILDPACGSGAFLNAALEFLMAEHSYIDELSRKLLGEIAQFNWTPNHILENNLYGVDINEEATEIARLSLWLRTASRERKLSNLSGKIKCGNSLIDDPEVAGDKAFKWEEEFPEVFAKGGFDVVLGNPPYVNVTLVSTTDKEYYKSRYFSFFKRYDLFGLFIEKALLLGNAKAKIAFIIPSVILNNLSYKKIRDYILKERFLEEVLYSGNEVFQDATVDTVVLSLTRAGAAHIKLVDARINGQIVRTTVALDYFNQFGNNISISSNDEDDSLFSKILNPEFELAEKYFDIFQGIVTGNNESFIFENGSENPEKIEEDLLHKLLYGRDISKWVVDFQGRLILYLDSKIKITNYPKAEKWMRPFQTVLEKRRECINGAIPWFALQWARDFTAMKTVPKILIQRTRNETLKPRIVATLDLEGYLGMEGLNFIIGKQDVKDVYWFIAILNSRLINHLFQTKFLNLAIKAEFLKHIPIPPIATRQKEILAENSKSMIQKHRELEQTRKGFIHYLQAKFPEIKTNNKLSNWISLSSADFLKELIKNKIKLSVTEERDWFVLFSTEQKKAADLQAQIDRTDKEIDQMVYALYGLTAEEIALVEGAA